MVLAVINARLLQVGLHVSCKRKCMFLEKLLVRSHARINFARNFPCILHVSCNNGKISCKHELAAYCMFLARESACFLQSFSGKFSCKHLHESFINFARNMQL